MVYIIQTQLAFSVPVPDPFCNPKYAISTHGAVYYFPYGRPELIRCNNGRSSKRCSSGLATSSSITRPSSSAKSSAESSLL